MKENSEGENQTLSINADKKKDKNEKKRKHEIQAPNTNRKKTIRNSSFELLRIILMILIALSHTIYHTRSLPKFDEKNYQRIINNNYILLRIISNYGQLGDIIFIMISGYFSIKRLNFHYIKFILIAT